MVFGFARIRRLSSVAVGAATCREARRRRIWITPLNDRIDATREHDDDDAKPPKRRWVRRRFPIRQDVVALLVRARVAEAAARRGPWRTPALEQNGR